MRAKPLFVLVGAVLWRLCAGFLVHSTKSRQTHCWASTRNNTAISRGTSKASEIISLLKTRYDDGNERSWKRTKAYVYRSSDRLTIKQVNQVVEFLDEFFDPTTTRSILTSCPRILRKNVSTQLQPTIQFLQDLYGEELFYQAISRNPHLLLSSGVGLARPNDEMDAYLSQTVGLTTRQVASLKQTAPFLFRLDKSQVQQVVDFIKDVLERGQVEPTNQDKILKRIITTHPLLMNLSVETNLKPRIEFLMKRCNLKEKDAATLIKSSSGIVLGLSVDDNLKPTLDYLHNLLARQDEDALRKCILRHPQLLALSLHNLQTKVDYFNAIDALCNKTLTKSLACRVALRAPAVYSLSLKTNIVPTVEFLARAWGTLPPDISWQGDSFRVKDDSKNQPQDDNDQRESLSSLLGEFPSILTLSLEGNIQPTLTFFNRTGYTCLDEQFKYISNKNARRIRGRYITASLFQRLLPRWHHVIANGWPFVEGDASTLPPLHLLVGATDRAFCEQLGYDYEAYVAFKEQSVPGLKFSSQFDTWLKTGRPIDIQ